MLTALLLLVALERVVNVIEQVDPIDDSHAVFAVIGTQRSHLAIGCNDVSKPESIQVIVTFERYIGNASPGILAGGRDIQYRFDAAPAQAVRWYSHDNQVFALSDINRPIKFILQMKGSRRVFFRTTNYSGDSVEEGFEYKDPDDAINKMLDRCGFSNDGKLK